MPLTYVNIASTTLGSTSSSAVVFNSIPNTYTDLLLKMSIRGTTNFTYSDLIVRFNSDSSTIYSNTNIYADGATVFSDRSAGLSFLPASYQGTGTTSSTFSSVEFYIPNYTSTVSKPVSVSRVTENNSTSSNFLGSTAGLYRNSSAISSISIGGGVNLAANSSFFLYGIKNS